MLRTIIAVIVGYVSWTILWLGGNAGIMAIRPDAFPQEGAITDTTALIMAIVLSVVCSIAGGIATAAVSKGTKGALVALAVALLLTGIGVQAAAWDRMPLWYHLAFLLLLSPVVMIAGTALSARRSESER